MWLKSFFRRGWLIALLSGAVVMLEGCFNDGDVYNPNQFFDTEMAAIKQYIIANNIDAEFDTLNSIYYQIHREGSGYKTVTGREVELHYQGETLEGKEFVNTYNGLPERVYLGVSLQSPSANPASYAWGLDQWLLHKRREGDSVTIFLPSSYAFKDQGYATVPPNTPVKYVVKYHNILQLSEDLEKIDQYISDKNWTSNINPDWGTRYVVHEDGDPDVNIDVRDYVGVRYKGVLLNDTIFDSNITGSAFYVSMGDGQVVIGFEMGLYELNKNDSATFFIPSIYGYGKDGSPPVIPGSAPLAFTTRILSVTKVD